MIAVPATAQRPKATLTANSPVLVEDVAGDGVRGVPEGSALLGMRGMLDERSCWEDLEEPPAKTSLYVDISDTQGKLLPQPVEQEREVVGDH